MILPACRHTCPTPATSSGLARGTSLSAFAFLLAAAILSTAHASQIRVETLGGESRFLLDDTNVFVFPALAADHLHANFEIFDDWAGLVLPVGDDHSAGLFFNRPTRQLSDLNSYVAAEGTPLFRQLEAKPWVDLLYGISFSARADVGLAGRVAYDVIESDGRKASARQSDLRLGLRLGARDGRQLDAAIGVQLQDLRDTSAAGAPLRETDGTGVSGDLRLRLPLGERFRMIHFMGVESRSWALAPSRLEHLSVDLGTGVNFMPTSRVLLVGGLVVSRQKSEQTAPGSPVFEETTLTLPAVHIGAEVQQGSMVFRLGVRQANELIDRVAATPGTPTRTVDSHFDLQLGLAFEFGPVLLDGHLERDFLRDGPDFLGGSRHGGGILSKVSVTYRVGR